MKWFWLIVALLVLAPKNQGAGNINSLGINSGDLLLAKPPGNLQARSNVSLDPNNPDVSLPPSLVAEGIVGIV